MNTYRRAKHSPPRTELSTRPTSFTREQCNGMTSRQASCHSSVSLSTPCPTLSLHCQTAQSYRPTTAILLCIYLTYQLYGPAHHRTYPQAKQYFISRLPSVLLFPTIESAISLCPKALGCIPSLHMSDMASPS